MDSPLGGAADSAPCGITVAAGASPTDWVGLSSLITSIDEHHSVASQLCLFVFFSTLHANVSARFVRCMRPRLQNIRLLYRTFDESSWTLGIRAQSDDTRVELPQHCVP